MSRHETELANGLRVVSHRMPNLETVSMGIWVGVGARHETVEQQGISHLLEHMAFKGTKRRSAKDIAEEIEAVGGELNAATSLETTAYFTRVLAGDIGLGLDILADILLNSRHAPGELEREREVILQEIAATRDSPDEIAYELLQEAAFPAQAIGRPILGTAASVKGFHPPDLRKFMKANYGAKRMVLSAAGKIDHDQLVRHAEALFGGMNGGAGGRFRAGALQWRHALFPQAVRAEPPAAGVRGSVVQRAGLLRRPGFLLAFRRGNIVSAVPGSERAPRPLLLCLLQLSGRWLIRACSEFMRRRGHR